MPRMSTAASLPVLDRPWLRFEPDPSGAGDGGSAGGDGASQGGGGGSGGAGGTQEPKPHTFPQGQEPAWAKGVPAKFLRATQEETMMALAAGYTHVEGLATRKGAQPQGEGGDGGKPDGKEGDGKTPEGTGLEIPKREEQVPTDGIGRILHTAKLKSEDITKQWTEHGKLTDDQYAAFEKLNPDPKNPIITREVIDTFLAGQQALGNDIKRTQQQMRGEAAQMVGGEEQLENMLETAEEYVPEDEIDDIRERLKSPKRFKGAMRDLMEHYNRHVGSEGSQPRVSDGQAPRDGGAGYTTQAEYFKALDEAEVARRNGTPNTTLERRIAATRPEVFMA